MERKPKKKYLFMNLTALLRTQHERSGEQLNNFNQIVANALTHVVENYFLQLATSFVLTLSCRNAHTANFYNDLLEKLFKTWVTTPIQIVNVEGNHTPRVPGRRNCNLILVDSYESFRSIDVNYYSAMYNNNEHYYIFLQARDHLIPAEMERIFEYCWTNHLIHCNVQIQNSRGEILIYTYYPFSWKKCGQVTKKLINQFNGTTLLNATLFPKKLYDFHGCTLRVATWNVPPFIYLEYLKNGNKRILGGIEGRLLHQLASKLNFKIEVKVPPNNEQRGVVKGDNVTGALYMLHKNYADLSLGSFRYAGNRASFSTTTYSYYQTIQVICVPLEAYALTSLDILLFPFTCSTWLLLLAIWMMGLIAIAFLKIGHKRFHLLLTDKLPSEYYLNIFKLAVGMPLSSMPKRYSSRILCVNWMLFTLVLRTAYQALLFHMIRTQLTNPVPQSFEELVAKNYTILMNLPGYLSLEEVSFLHILHSQIINDTNDTIQYEYLENNPRKNLAAAGPLDFLLYYVSVYEKPGIFKILPQSIVSFPITIYLKKHSFLTDQFNEEVLWLRSMGFIDAWSRWELDYKYMGSEHHMKDKIFGLREIYMVFVMLFLGYGFASLCFVLEMASTRMKFLKKLFLKI